nr:hypothetical protein [Tanacetum cinerariifolium]
MERANKVKTLKLRRLRKVGTSQRIESSDDTIMKDVSNQGRMIDDSAAAIVPAAVTETVSTAAVVPGAVTAIPVKVVVPSTRRSRGVVIRDPEEESSAKLLLKPSPRTREKLHEELNQDIDWEVAMDHVKQKAKENPYVQRYQTMKKRPQTKAQAQKNMMMYLKNTAEENRAIANINETLAQKAAKRRRLNKEAEDVEELKQHLQIVPNEDDDVYAEANPLARKVPVMDYQIIHFNNKPQYKIIRTDETHQLYVSFITLLKNFDREDLESLFGVDAAMELKEKHQGFTAASEDISAARKKLMLMVTAVRYSC